MHFLHLLHPWHPWHLQRQITMRFILNMAARETRAAWKRLLFFFVCIAIGVGAIVALRSVIQSVRSVLVREARTILGADVVIRTNRPWTPEGRRRIDSRLAAAPVLVRTEAIETATMVRAAERGSGRAKLVELRGVQAAFPLYGQVKLQGGRPYSHALVRARGALVRPELLTQLGIQVGDDIQIGRQRFTVRGVIETEPGRSAGAFSMGSRILVDHADLESSGLLTFGSRAGYQILLRVEDRGVQPLVDAIRSDFSGQFVGARSYRSTEENIGQDLEQTENYLSLVALIVIVLGGIGVSSVTRVFVQQKIRSIAVLKCLGAGTRQVLAVYLLQVTALGFAGSALGVALAAVAVASIPEAYRAAGGLRIEYQLTLPAAVQGLAIGVLVALLFAIVPLLDVRNIKPSLLLRQEIVRRRGLDWTRLGAMAAVAAALVLVASWQAASWRVGLTVSGGFVGVSLVLHLVGRALVRLVRPIATTTWFPLRHAALRISRPGNQTRVILLAVGLGSFFIIGVRVMQANLLAEFALELREGAPDMFLIDIQKDQVEEMRTFLRERAEGRRFLLMPVLRARVTGVRGSETNLDGYEDVRGRGSLAREYVITYRSTLAENERIVAGRFWPEAHHADAAEVSIEEGIHERFRINIGDTVRFDVLGRIVEARVTSIRKVDWRDSRAGGFMFVFSPGVFEAAPQTFIGPLAGPPDPGARAQFQHELVTRFPNVSVIDVREVLQTIRQVIANVTLAITVVGGLVLLSGSLILVGAVAMTKFQRIYEAAIFKTLGASTRALASMLLIEYGLLGTLAGAIGSVGAIALSWSVSKWVLKIPWRAVPIENVAGVAATALLVTAIGVGASLDVLRKKPLATLRAE